MRLPPGRAILRRWRVRQFTDAQAALDEVAEPLGAAGAGDADLLERWTIAFAEDIDEPSSPADASQKVARLLPNGDLVVWERNGEAVSMAAVVRRTPWSSSVAYVYTPPPLRRGATPAPSWPSCLSASWTPGSRGVRC